MTTRKLTPKKPAARKPATPKPVATETAAGNVVDLDAWIDENATHAERTLVIEPSNGAPSLTVRIRQLARHEIHDILAGYFTDEGDPAGDMLAYASALIAAAAVEPKFTAEQITRLYGSRTGEAIVDTLFEAVTEFNGTDTGAELEAIGQKVGAR